VTKVEMTKIFGKRKLSKILSCESVIGSLS